jgi:hypothetical protein
MTPPGPRSVFQGSHTRAVETRKPLVAQYRAKDLERVASQQAGHDSPRRTVLSQSIRSSAKAAEVDKRMEKPFEQETKVRRESLAALKDQAKAERKDLESLKRK